jgi:transcriptional regulator with XRE-family HTH domain
MLESYYHALILHFLRILRNIRSGAQMLIASQIRSARGALGWSASELGEQAGLSLRTVQTAESEGGEDKIRKSSLLAIKSVLESAGIEFIGTPEDAPGIRIHPAGKAQKS